MTNKILLNNVDHHDLRVIARHDAAWGDSVNQAIVFPTEFAEVQRDYPIFLVRGPDGGVQAVALLGLDRDENLFLGPGGWTGRYVPALHRRGPFSIGLSAQQEGEGPMIHIDLDDPRVSRSDGDPLFLPHGGNAPRLEHIADALRTIYAGVETGNAMYAAFDALGLIEPVTVQISLSDTERYDLPGFSTIGTGRLAALSGPELEGLHRAGFLQAAFLITASLANVSRLIDLKNAKRAAAR